MSVKVPKAPYKEAGVDIGTPEVPKKAPPSAPPSTARQISFNELPVAVSSSDMLKEQEKPIKTEMDVDIVEQDTSEPKTPKNVIYIRDFMNETTESIDPKVTTGNTTRDPCQVPPNSQIGMLSGIQKLTLNSTSEPALQHWGPFLYFRLEILEK